MSEQDRILSLIPHRPPFLWVDRIVERHAGSRCVAAKFIDPAEPFFEGHFPGKPILPGVFLIEAAAQTAALMLHDPPAGGEASGPCLLAAVNSFKFLKPVSPGSEIRIEVRQVSASGPVALVAAVISAGGELVAKGELLLVTGRET